MNPQAESARAVIVRQRQGSQNRVASQELLGADDIIVIEHSGQEYFLRQTRAGKLILTK